MLHKKKSPKTGLFFLSIAFYFLKMYNYFKEVICVKRNTHILLHILYSLLFACITNSYFLVEKELKILWILVPLVVFMLVFAGVLSVKLIPLKLKICYHGAVLLSAFLVSAFVSVIYHTVLAFQMLPNDYKRFLNTTIYSILLNAIIFWVGIICVYICSYKLGIKLRIKGILCGMIPVANLIVLYKILVVVYKEIDDELVRANEKRNRKTQKLCNTKYPILLVHGVFFRDTVFFNYWGRIPEELKFNAAKIFYGKHKSAASVKDSAKELEIRIEKIVNKTGCQKVNIIAHSKGGLDCRYAIAKLGIADKVASLTTVNTPHRGCLFADYLLEKIPNEVKEQVANTYNKTIRFLGEKDADFLSAVNNLTDSYCTALDKELGVPDGIYSQSIGSVMKTASGGMFPLNFSYHLAANFDGINDGLVSENSFKWGENYILLTPTGERGISHGDVIDLSRQDIDGFDVREFYVDLVNKLKRKGL